MRANINSTDKVVRILLAVVAVVLYFTGTVTGTPGIILLIVGGILLLTSLISFCPIYHLLGISTKKK
ncbi:MAG: DUF2892 domain-containing protein [Ginsengibacter sp.]|jgi:hypothetical protein